MSGTAWRANTAVFSRQGIGVGLATAAWAAPTTAAAFHDTVGVGGGAPLHVLLLLVAAVAIGMVALSLWKPKGRHRSKAPTRGVKPAAKKRRRHG